MRMNRRNVLVGLGTIVAGGGAALGTGAFSTVEADRTVDLQTSADTDALLGLTINDSTLTGRDGSDSNTNQTIKINETDINYDALTTFTDALTLTNNSSNTNVKVRVTDGSVGGKVGNNVVKTSDPSSSDRVGMYLVADSTASTDINGSTYDTIDISSGPVSVDIVINTLGVSSGSQLSSTNSLLFTAIDSS